MIPSFRPDQWLSLVIVSLTVLLFPSQVRSLTTQHVTQLKPFPVLKTNLEIAIPEPDTADDPAFISARSALVFDLKNPSILYEKSATTQLPQASLTKLMTALVAEELYDPQEIISITEDDLVEGNVMDLKIGEQITVDSLMQGLLILSANDAATALAAHHPQGAEGFVAAMNQKANELHLAGTLFQNPTGFDEDNHYSTSFDLAVLTKAVLESSYLRKIISTPTTTVYDITGNLAHELSSTNQLLFTEDSVLAGKTGTTELAGECLITVINQDNHPVVIVLLGSQDRYQDTLKLMNWVYQNYDWVNPSIREEISAL